MSEEPAKRPFASAFIAMTLGLLTVTLVRGQENYPLTVAPMFARDVIEDRPRYTMHWFITNSEGEHEVFPGPLLGVHPRQFFIRWYGPHGQSAYIDAPEDPGWPAFGARMARWFTEMSARHAASTGKAVYSARLVVRRVHPSPAQEHTLGTFDPATNTFSEGMER